MKRFRVTVAAGLIAAAGITSVLAAGNWSTLPIVGGAAFCTSTSSGVTLPAGQGPYGVVPGSTQGTGNSVCGPSAPIGPSIVTGNELVPADTLLPNSASPQTVTLPMASFNALPLFFITNLSAGTTAITMDNNQGGIIIDSTGTITQTTITMPAAPIDGQQFVLDSNKSITTLVIAPASGQTIATEALTTGLTVSVTAPYGYGYVYHAANLTWYRLR